MISKFIQCRELSCCFGVGTPYHLLDEDFITLGREVWIN